MISYKINNFFIISNHNVINTIIEWYNRLHSKTVCRKIHFLVDRLGNILSHTTVQIRSALCTISLIERMELVAF